MNEDWPFADPKDVGVYTLRQIVRDGQPILYISHDEEDGAWQFLDGGDPRIEDAMLVCLEHMVNLDPSIRELSDLPFGWCATRSSQTEPWQRIPCSPD